MKCVYRPPTLNVCFPCVQETLSRIWYVFCFWLWLSVGPIVLSPRSSVVTSAEQTEHGFAKISEKYEYCTCRSFTQRLLRVQVSVRAILRLWTSWFWLNTACVEFTGNMNFSWLNRKRLPIW